MNGVPLHPMIVHFPIVLSILLPIFALGTWWAIRRGASPRTWLLPVGVGAALAVSAFVALRTGQAEEERVEQVVSESAIHEHEEAAERFLVFSGVLVGLLAAGLLGGGFGRVARGLGAAGAVALVVAGVQVGRAGGELVYRQGAASAYASGSAVAGAGGGEGGAGVEAAAADRPGGSDVDDD